MNSVALRVQDLDRSDQVLVLLHLAQIRSDSGTASATEIAEQYMNLAITPPPPHRQRASRIGEAGPCCEGSS